MRIRRPEWLFTLAITGCAGGSLADRELADLRKRLDESQGRLASTDKKVEELEDRVFLLTDQLESQKLREVARAPSRRLPVVTLQPRAEADDASPREDEVEYAGEARRPSGSGPLTFDNTSFADRGIERGVEPRRPRAPAPAAVASTGPSRPTGGTGVGGAGDNLGVAPAPPIPTASLAPAPVPRPLKGEASADPLRLYRAAYEALRAGRHADAEAGFRDFVKRFPRHDYADNAKYWLGECFYDRKDYGAAAREFRAVVADYPVGNKAPDALLKLGFSLLAAGEAAKGREVLAQVPQSYPRTEAARLAAERLGELGPRSDLITPDRTEERQ